MSSLTASPSTTIRRATPADAGVLASLAVSTFIDTFGADNTPENMAMYVSSAFGEAAQRVELEDGRHAVFFAERDGAVVGYVMLRTGSTPEVIGESDAIEIARLYSVKDKIGSGIGATLMQCALDEAARAGKDSIWLAVWERNPRAIAFYQRWQFERKGTLPFMLGHDRQSDHLLARRVAS